MPIYRPILSAHDLPNEGDGQERAVRDLKKDWRDTKAAHKAKDVAAFANHLGGTLIIGASETNGRVDKYHPLSEQVANEGKAAFSQAVRDKCSPKPVFDPLVLPRDNGFVIVINVEPEIGSVVGVSVPGDKARDGLGEPSFLFPVRSGVDSVFLPPEKLPMFMEPRYRRLLIMLSKIPAQTEIVVKIPLPGHSWSRRRFIAVDTEANVIQFDDGTLSKTTHMPIDLVQSVFQTASGQWRLVLTTDAHYSLQD